MGHLHLLLTSSSRTTRVRAIQSSLSGRDRIEALSWINDIVSEPLLGQIVSCKSTDAAWQTLKKSFISQSPLRIMLLKKELHFIQKKTMTMQTYLERIKLLVDTLSAAGHEIDDSDLFQITMNGVASGSYLISFLPKKRDLIFSKQRSQILTILSKPYHRWRIKRPSMLFEDEEEAISMDEEIVFKTKPKLSHKLEIQATITEAMELILRFSLYANIVAGKAPIRHPHPLSSGIDGLDMQTEK
ncbi:hypothetical protein EJ110_NYTH46861 [Nymphaea thermarum]|nr:hypothetical protein EJ110_NYTH46861 [Nymphaea thermarum]